MRDLIRWLFRDAFSVTVGGTTYVPNWEALSAIGTVAATAAAVAAIWYSVRLVHRQIQYQDQVGRTDADRNRILELKRLEQSYLMRIFDQVDQTYHSVVLLSLRAQALANGREAGMTVEAALEPMQRSRELVASTAAILNIVKASRSDRFPANVADEVFSTYVSFVNTVVTYNKQLVEFVAQNPQTSSDELHAGLGQRVFVGNQIVKAATGRVIALMFGREDEWNSREFLTFANDVMVKAPVIAEQSD